MKMKIDVYCDNDEDSKYKDYVDKEGGGGQERIQELNIKVSL